MTIVGTKKMLLWDDLAKDKLILFDKGVDIVNHKTFEYYDTSSEIIEYENTEPLSLMVAEFAKSIMEERNPLSSGEEGLRTLCLLEAANRSLVESKRIQV